MNRAELEKYIAENYGVKPEYLWIQHPHYGVFRHKGNRKWFAVMMDVPKGRLGLPEEGILDVVNFKCDPLIIGSLRVEPGFFPAYHMNKGYWITVALDGSVPDDQIKMLLGMSFENTQKPKIHQRRSPV